MPESYQFCSNLEVNKYTIDHGVLCECSLTNENFIKILPIVKIGSTSHRYIDCCKYLLGKTLIALNLNNFSYFCSVNAFSGLVFVFAKQKHVNLHT